MNILHIQKSYGSYFSYETRVLKKEYNGFNVGPQRHIVVKLFVVEQIELVRGAHFGVYQLWNGFESLYFHYVLNEP